MGKSKIKNMVVFSTLNQITNYLIIRRYEPEKIFNITFERESAQNLRNRGINSEDWDKNLKESLKEIKITPVEIEYTEINMSEYMRKKIKDEILNTIPKEEAIYWHITGGQRIHSLIIHDLIQEENRINDILIYMEANTERLLIKQYNKKNQFTDQDLEYGDEELTFNQALRLSGFKTKELRSTLILKEKSKANLSEEIKKEYKFYKQLYKTIKGNKTIYKVDDQEGCFMTLLLQSNKKENENEREKFVRELFERLLSDHEKLKKSNCGYDIFKSDDLTKYYPAGYIFEKLTGYQIYKAIEKNPKIVGMEMSLKTYFTESSVKDNIVDELDIVLLTKTGKIINFECKSGGMTGDNAKSHNYTTYRLSGVFGLPIFLTPLCSSWKVDGEKKDKFKNQYQAFRAAQNAELQIIHWDDDINEKIKTMLE